MIILRHYHGNDRVCNYCNRFRRKEADPQVNFYEMLKDGDGNSFVMVMCEYCARSLYEQLGETVAPEG